MLITRAMSKFSPPAARHRRPVCAALALCLTLLAGCPSGPGTRPDAEATAARYVSQGRHAEAGEMYERLARRATAAERDTFYLAASRAWLEAGQAPRALTNLDQVQGPLPAGDSALDLLTGYRLLRDGRPRAALDHLAGLRQSLPQRYLGLWYELRGRAFLQDGDASRAVGALVERELWLTRGEDIEANRELIWRALTTLAQKGASLEPDPASDALTRGWFELARAHAQLETNYFAGAEALRAWQAAHPAHPGEFIALRLLAAAPETLEYPANVALLLPLRGRFAGTAAAIRDGFLAAYLQDGARPDRPTVRLYDTGEQPTGDALRRALDDGAHFVVGPLLKSAVEGIAVAPIDAGVLTLNTLPDDALPRANFFQFGLVPEDEAVTVARRALEEGKTRALALVPNNEWGERMLNAFATELQSYGGRLLSHAVYETGDNDFRIPITQLLNLNESRERHRQVQAIAGMVLEFEPRRRRDVEFVFVAADERQGRLIRPAFLYHFAEDLPLYATSAIYEADARANGRDLDGLVFADMPWILRPDEAMLQVQEALGRHWPSRMNRRGRFYALGYDAYRLIPQLTGEAPLAEPLAGATGDLLMGPGGRIVRRLDVAQIRGGLAVRLDPVRGADPGLETPMPDPAEDDAAAATGAGGAP